MEEDLQRDALEDGGVEGHGGLGDVGDESSGGCAALGGVGVDCGRHDVCSLGDEGYGKGFVVVIRDEM